MNTCSNCKYIDVDIIHEPCAGCVVIKAATLSNWQPANPSKKERIAELERQLAEAQATIADLRKRCEDHEHDRAGMVETIAALEAANECKPASQPPDNERCVKINLVGFYSPKTKTWFVYGLERVIEIFNPDGWRELLIRRDLPKEPK